MRPSPAIRHAEIDGLRVVLDLECGVYRAFDDVASVMWAALAGERSREAVLQALSAAYDAPYAVLQRDLELFEARCLHDGLLRTDCATEPNGPMAPHRPQRLRWHTVSALRTLVATSRAIARNGLRSVYERCEAVPLGAPSVPLSRAIAAFRAAEYVYVSRRAPDDCLARSLALYRYLREAGFRVRHTIGVQRVPFRAHAWVELGGTVLLDRGVERFAALATLGP